MEYFIICFGRQINCRVCEYYQDKETEVQTPAWVRLRQSSVENFIFI